MPSPSLSLSTSEKDGETEKNGLFENAEGDLRDGEPCDVLERSV